jgi:transmembrane sensor
MTEIRLSELLTRYLEETLSEEQRLELSAALEQKENAHIAEEIIGMQLASGDLRYEGDLSYMYERISGMATRKVAPVHRVHFLHRFRWAAAAAVLILAFSATWFLLNRDHKELKETVVAKADVKAPATNRAMITRANGETVYLDGAANGKLASLENITLEKLADGQIAYSGNNTGKVEINTITNPKGSKVIDMTLTDGTHVWLNAGSSLTYTVPLIKRDVTVTGEAYFEVAHDANKPFTVSKGDAKVTVLGTHFNMNAYDDESEIKVTLLEGSVRVNKGIGQMIIKPGQQAKIGEQINIGQDVDLDEVMAWKNGFFQFDHAGLPEVMRQVSRWYDVQIKYEGSIPVRDFVGEIERGLNLSQLLKILEKNQVNFRLDNKTLVVTP